jgi:hypothetical protein
MDTAEVYWMPSSGLTLGRATEPTTEQRQMLLSATFSLSFEFMPLLYEIIPLAYWLLLAILMLVMRVLYLCIWKPWVPLTLLVGAVFALEQCELQDQ